MLERAVNFLRARKWLVTIIILCFAVALTFLFASTAHGDELPLPPNTPGETTEQVETPPADQNSALDQTSEPDQPTDAEVAETCQTATGSIGWIVCPTTGWLSNGVDSIYSVIEYFLALKPIFSDANSPIFMMWNYSRDLANVVFIIVFLIAILSQITGFGFNNYSLKKILPKLIIGALLINISFIVCALAVDLSNIIGSSLKGLFDGIQADLILQGAISSAAADNTFGVFATGIIGGTAAIGGTIYMAGGIVAALWLLIPLVLTFIFAVVAALLTLVARQALIYILIMIAPLAIICYILPNTEKWFEKWRSIFMSMLVLFPMIALLFGAAKLAGWAIIASATDIWGVLLGFAVMIIPLVFAPSMFKMSNTVLGKVNEFARRSLSPISKRGDAWARGRSSEAAELARQKRLSKDFSGHSKYNPLDYSARWAQWTNNRAAVRKDKLKNYKEAAENRTADYLGRKRQPRFKRSQPGQYARYQSSYTRSAARAKTAAYSAERSTTNADNALRRYLAETDKSYEVLEGEVLQARAEKAAVEELAKTAATERLVSSGEFAKLAKTYDSAMFTNILASQIATTKSYKKHRETSMDGVWSEFRPSTEFLDLDVRKFITRQTSSLPLLDKGTGEVRVTLDINDKVALETAVSHFIADNGSPRGIIDFIHAWSKDKRGDIVGKTTKWLTEAKTEQNVPFMGGAFMDHLNSSEKQFGNVYRYILEEGVHDMKPKNWSTQIGESAEILLELVSGKHNQELRDSGLTDQQVQQLIGKAETSIMDVDAHLTPEQSTNMSTGTRAKVLQLIRFIKKDKNPYKGTKTKPHHPPNDPTPIK